MQNEIQLQFSDLIDKNKPIIYKVINGYCQNQSAHDDLYQEILLEAWSSYSKFKWKSSFSTWLYCISKNIAIDRINKSKRTKEILVDNFLWEIVDEPSKDEEYRYDLSIIDTLTKAEKTTLNYRIDGLTFAEISKITGEPVNRLIIRMHRIKRMLLNKPKSPKK